MALSLNMSLGYAQEKLSGKVVEQNGSPISHVKIQWKDDKVFFYTNEEGKFEIPFRGENLLKFSHALYQNDSLLITNKSKPIQIILKHKTTSIEEVQVVHTGYQKIAKERSTGSFEFMGQKELNQRVTTNILENMEGFVPGVLFDRRNGDDDISIRGINTFSTLFTGPLIILDNFPYDGNINSINPQDVESITILKDAAAASIWRSRAGNGVIVINTKKSKDGKVKVESKLNFFLAEKSRIMDLPIVATKEFLELEEELYHKGIYKSLLNENPTSLNLINPFVRLLEDHRLGKVTESEFDEKVAFWKGKDYRSDLLEQYYRNQLNKQMYLSLNGGAQNFQNRISLTYDHNNLSTVTSKFERQGLLWSGVYKPISKITIDYNLSLNFHQNYDTRGSLNYPIIQGRGRGLYPYASLMDNAGNPTSIEKSYPDRFKNHYLGQYPKDWTYVPLKDLFDSEYSSFVDQTRNNLIVSYQPFSFIKLSAQYGINYQLTRNRTLFSERSYHVRELQNSYSRLVNGIPTSYIPDGGLLQKSLGVMKEQRLRLQANFDFDFLSNHKFYSLIGVEGVNQPIATENYQYYGFNDKYRSSQVVDNTTRFPSFQGLFGTRALIRHDAMNLINRRILSMFANGTYSIKNRYFLSGSMRRDAANTFGVAVNDRWTPLWSAGLSWNMTDETFIKFPSFIDFLKWRVTLGKSGVSGTGNSPRSIISIRQDINFGLLTNQQAYLSSLPNVNLRWEKVYMLNIGLDYRLFNNRISGSLEMFNKINTDIMDIDEVDPTSGVSTMTFNAGNMRGNGFDFSIKSKNMQGNFNWESQAFISMAINKVEKVYRPNLLGSGILTNKGRSLYPVKGKPLYPLYGLKWNGLDSQGDPIGYLKGRE